MPTSLICLAKVQVFVECDRRIQEVQKGYREISPPVSQQQQHPSIEPSNLDYTIQTPDLESLDLSRSPILITSRFQASRIFISHISFSELSLGPDATSVTNDGLLWCVHTHTGIESQIWILIPNMD